MTLIAAFQRLNQPIEFVSAPGGTVSGSFPGLAGRAAGLVSGSWSGLAGASLPSLVGSGSRRRVHRDARFPGANIAGCRDVAKLAAGSRQAELQVLQPGGQRPGLPAVVIWRGRVASWQP